MEVIAMAPSGPVLLVLLVLGLLAGYFVLRRQMRAEIAELRKLVEAGNRVESVSPVPSTLETNGEFFFVWERLRPTIQEGRQRFSNPLFLAHLEKAANRFETWIEGRAPGHVAAMRQMMKQMAAQAGKAA